MSTPLTPIQAALNATPVKVLYRDGREEEITLRQLEITDLYKYIDGLASDDVPKIVALCCGKDAAWINSLTVRSYAALSRMAVEQNFPLAMEIIQSDPIAAAKCSKLLAQLDEAAEILLKSSASSLLGRASSASAEGTSTGSSDSPAAASSS